MRKRNYEPDWANTPQQYGDEPEGNNVISRHGNYHVENQSLTLPRQLTDAQEGKYFAVVNSRTGETVLRFNSVRAAQNFADSKNK